ncbi:S1C family serine protease [Oceaniglobus trochenteri]|uniref:S1C family serine protease n=1 Tax=Oceaniglobus trochenteri TaxID=2763260 RepID=UPI001CFFC016|nr:trypsin-like peptidase domain-containing protein [Oceaniglobus trochenteri]
MDIKVLTARFTPVAPLLRAAFLMALILAAPLAAEARSGLERAVAATLIVLGDGDRPLGSAVLLEDGLVLSVVDVVGGRAEVTLRDGEGRQGRARVVARDAGRGLVLLRIEGAGFGLAGLPLGPVTLPVGHEVFAVGAPLGMDVMLTRGIIAAAARQPDPTIPVQAVQHDALLNEGVAGGPLVDGEGRLIGLNRKSPEGALAGVGWAIAAGDLARLVPLMAAGKLRDVPDLGLTLRRVTPAIADALGIAPVGLLVDSVAPRSRAGQAGLMAGDVLLGYEDETLATVAMLAMLIDRREGDEVRLNLRRGQADLTVTLDLAPVGNRLGALAVSSAGVGRIASYTFASLGVVLEDAGRVGHVNYHSPAYVAGLLPGDSIIALNGAPVDRATLEALTITGPILLLVARGGNTLHVLVDPWADVPRAAMQSRANLLDAGTHLF